MSRSASGPQTPVTRYRFSYTAPTSRRFSQRLAKYRLTLTIATQTLGRLPRDSLCAGFGNCTTIISFRTSGKEAFELKDEFAGLAKAELIQELGKDREYVRMLMDRVPQGPYQMETLPPIEWRGRKNSRERVINASRFRKARPRATGEEKLRKSLSQ